MTRPCRTLIDLAALKHNFALARACAPQSLIAAVVKANAYGHGAEDVAKVLENQAEVLAVSCLEEAEALRIAGIRTPLLMLEGCFSEKELTRCLELDVQLVCHQQQQIEMLRGLHGSARLTVWLKVDTGMHRLGITPQQAPAAYAALKAFDGVERIVLTTHLANADDVSSDYTRYQLDNFDRANSVIELSYDEPVLTSIPNSAGLMAWPDSHSSYHRPGIMLYGLSPFSQPHPLADTLCPVMTFEADIIALRAVEKGAVIGYGNQWQAQRRSVIATVAAGYGDGYPRTAVNGTPAWVRGKTAPLAGRVSMDMLMLDVTDVPGVSVGDTAELWGKHVSANEVAACAGTIGYELVTRMTGRARRELC